MTSETRRHQRPIGNPKGKRLMRVFLIFCIVYCSSMPYLSLADDSAFTASTTTALISQLGDGSHLILFYRDDCAPCHAELQELSFFKDSLPHWQLTVASMTKPSQAFVAKLNTQHVQVIDMSEADGVQLLRDFGDRKTALPFSAALTHGNEVCATHTGLLGTDNLDVWRHECSR